ncbi:MAG: Cna B-type domain-containing protein, partial [Ruminiclostridium sp.]|nr:Cna B-type domain-containing protein [Ruminiclostridium sp.]
VEQAESGTVYNDSNVPVGTYTVATDGTISIVFDSTYRSQNATGSQISGKLTFHAEVQATGSGSGTQETFSYGNSQTFTVDFTNDVPKGDISVDKEISKVEGDIIYYTIEVYSEQGTFGPVEINDRIDDNGGYYYIQNTMTVRDKNSNPVDYTSLAFRDKNGNTSPEESANKGFLMQLPQMGARETYVIDCTVHVNDDNTIDVTDKHLTNDVEAASKNNAGRDIHGKDNVRLDWKLLKKSGTYNADTDSYEYTLTVNEMGTNLNGWQLQDTCNGVPLTNYTATIRDTTTGSTTTVTLPYTFGDHVFAQGDSTHQYTVTYSFASEALYVENNAQMSYTGTGLTVTASTLTGKGDIGEGALSKSGTLGNVILLSNGTPAREVIWTVTLDHADFDIPAGAYFDDSLYKSGGFYKNYYTHDQLIDNATAVVNAVEGQGGTVGSIQVWTWQYDAATGTNGTSGSTTYASLSDLTGNLPQSNQYQAFRVTLDTDLPKGSTPLTFQYTSTLETPSSTSAIYGIQNQFKVSSIPKLDKTASVNLVPSNPSIVKKGMNASGSLVDVEETEINYDKLANVGGNKDNLHWQLMLTVPENYTAQQGVVLEDQVPADLYVVQVEPKTQGTGANHCWYVNNPDGKYGHGTYQSVTRDGNAATLYLHGAGGTVIGDSAGYQVGWDMEITANNLLRITLNEDAIQYLADMQKFYTTGDLYTYSGTWKPATADDVVLTIDIYARNPDLNWQYPYDNRPFENTVVVKDDNGTRMDSDSQTTAVIRDQRKGLLDKRGEALKLDGQLSNTVAYDIAINPGEDNHDLLPYSNELLIADELVFNDHFPCYCGNGNDGKHIDASLVPGSVKLYKVSSRDWKGNPVVEEEVPVTYRYSKWEEAGYKGAIERHKQIELTVEDGFDYHLHYEYKFEGDYGGTIYDLINNITIFGTPGGDTKSDTTVKFNVQDSGAVANTKGAILYKVDASDFGTYLQGAQFEVFRYNPNESPDPYTSMGTYPTDTEGKIELSTNSNAAISFAYNTAYKLVERTPPTGYFLDPTPYEFYIENADTTSYPPCIPANFSGEKLQDGALIYFPDDKNSTSIRVDKFWLDEDENPIDAPAGASITFDLLQDDTLIGTYTANAAGITAAAGSTGTANGTAWSYTISGLPYAPTNTDNTAGTPYKYTVQEASLSGYQASYTNNDGISSGTISIFNQEESDDGYVLPKTGGAGTTGILTAGAALCGLALLGLYRVHVKKKAAAAD